MNTQRFLIGLSIANLALLVYLFGQARPIAAQNTPTQMLRGRGLEIVDEQGKLRASIKIQPADPSVRMPNGKTLADTVILRLITPEGRPAVKLTTSVHGGELGIAGEHDPTYVLLEAEGDHAQVKVTNKDGKQQIVKP